MSENPPEQLPSQTSTPPIPGNASGAPSPSAGFAAPVRGPTTADRILVVMDAADADPLLDRYLEIMAAHEHPCEVLTVPGGDPHAARSRVRAHAGIRNGTIQGIQVFGHSIPSFRLRYFYPNSTLDSRGASDLPYGSDFEFFDRPFNPPAEFRKPAWNVSELTAALTPLTANYGQDQWVARIFRLDEGYLENLATTQPPQINNMLVVNADPVFKNDPGLNERVRGQYRARYGTLTAGQNSRFAFLEADFDKGQLFDFLAANLTNATFLSVADHGTSSNLENLPPSRGGIPQLPWLPDVVEFAACGAGDWMEEEAPGISVVEAALRNGALTVVAAQCLLAWNFTRGYPDLHPGTNPLDQDNQNPSPMLDIWPATPSLGRAQALAVGQALNLLKTSVYNDKAHIVFQVVCGHGLFGDGTVEFAARSFA